MPKEAIHAPQPRVDSQYLAAIYRLRPPTGDSIGKRGYTDRMSRNRALPALAAALVGLALLADCATRKPTAPLPEPAPSAKIEAASAITLDQYRLRLPFILVLRNPRSAALRIESDDYALYVEGAEAGKLAYRETRTVEAGEASSIALEFPVDIRDLSPTVSGSAGPAEAAWRIQARVGLRTSDGAFLELAAEGQGSFPIVREPLFRIRSVRIERDLLVTTNLRLALEIENPNAFPIELRSFSYDFFGEGKIWADGGNDEALAVPAKGSVERGLGFTMNFADMDRKLFDLVAKLQVVRYRLSGEARIATGLEYLPAFVTRFDREGNCAVER